MAPSHPQATAGQRLARRSRRWLVGASAVVGTVLGVQAAGGPPTFFLIEPFLKRAVLVHFDTEANRRYDLEFSTNALSSPPGTWRSIYTVDPLPFDDHFIVYHETTNGPVGAFRLVATP
jgi:hypothetical protein